MANGPVNSRRIPIWFFVSLAWLAPALLASMTTMIRAHAGGEPVALKDMVWDGGDWLLYGLITPIVFLVGRRYPLTGPRFPLRLLVHFLASIGLCAAWAGGGILLWRLLYGHPATPYGGGAWGWMLTSLPFGVAVYFAVLGAERAATYLFEAREQETQAARLNTQLAEARLGALRMQLQPHFLFNALNAITVVVRDRDTVTAARMLEQLGEVLHQVIRSDRPQEIPLADELDFLRRILELEQVRFSDRLRPEFAVDQEVLGAAVPDFVLQPLVENALRHGLAAREAATLLRIEARQDGNALVLSVTDDGPGPAEGAAERREGVGLANTRERLAALYGPAASLALSATPGGGARATIRIPFRLVVPQRPASGG
ncbi:MAG TPA: histidine kinase [Gemmatimonadales bacterium]|nr:histidine kinase [Gemmatimonadales bacterium]